MTQHIAVIGGGVIGLATAWALVCNDQRVTLIEPHAGVAEETSHANAGQLSYRYVSPLADAGVPLKALSWMMQGNAAPLKFRPQLDPAQWRWCLAFLLACRRSVNRRNGEHLLRLALHSQTILNQWREQYALDGFDWRRNGKLVIYRNRKSFDVAASKASSMEGQRALDAADCLTLEPALQAIADKFAGGIYSDSDESADCFRFCQTLEQRLLESGHYQRLQQTVTGFGHAAGHIKTLHLTGGDRLGADQYVLAAGNESGKLAAKLGIHLPLYPLKGYSLTLPLTADAVVPDTSVTDFDHKVVYARLGDKLRVAAMVDIGARNNEPDPRRLAALRRLCADTFPQAGDYNRAQVWAGLRPSTPQGPPIIGASPFGNLWLNTGHGSLGFTLASASGQILAELIAGRPAPVSLEGLSLASCDRTRSGNRPVIV